MEIIKVKGQIKAINVADNVANIRLQTQQAENPQWKYPNVYKCKLVEIEVTFGYNSYIRPAAIAALCERDFVEVEVHKANELSYTIRNISRINRTTSLIGLLSEIDRNQHKEDVPETYFDERPLTEEELEEE